jgi:hypothetical protein
MTRAKLAVLMCMAVTPARAADPVASPVPVAEAAASTKYQPTTRSSCRLTPGARNPFLPIGWVKREAGQIAAPTVTIGEDMFRVTSILLGSPSMAVINGRSYEEGQFIRMPKAAPQVRPRLYRIGDGKVWIQVNTQLVTVPLRRPELNEPKAEELILNEDREDEITAPTVSTR